MLLSRTSFHSTGHRSHAAHQAPVVREIKEVFVSSTIHDLDAYREEVFEALKKGEFGISRIDDWSVSIEHSVLKECQRRVEAADGYIGIFAHYYGSIPVGSDKSVTHLEFCWAKAHNEQHTYPLLGVFRPKGDADKVLEAMAKALLETKDQAYKDSHPTRLADFLDTVSGGDQWVFEKYFKDESDLRERVLIMCGKTWTNQLLKMSRSAQEKPVVSPELLGMLGRKKIHMRAVEDARDEAFDETPALAMLIYGDEEAGQEAFYQYLLPEMCSWDSTLVQGRPVGGLTYDFASLIDWISGGLPGPEGRPHATSLEELAEQIHEALMEDQVTVLLDRVEEFQGGVTAFQEIFWQPLYEQLETLTDIDPVDEILLFFVVAYIDDVNAWAGSCCATGGATEYTQVLLLPPLTDFTEGDVNGWLREVNLRKDPRGIRQILAKEAMKTAEGQEDGTPQQVFKRLQRKIATQWPNGDWRNEE